MAITFDPHLDGGTETDLDLADLSVLASDLSAIANADVTTRREHAELLTRAVSLHDQLQRIIGSIADTADQIAAPCTVGEKSVPALLRAACRTKSAQTKQFLTLGRARHRFPTFTNAHRNRAITSGHVEAINDLASRVDLQQLAAAEPHLCAAAMVSTVEEFSDACREWEAAADPSKHLDSYIAAQARRHFVMANDLFGNLHVEGTFPALEGEALQAMVDQRADALLQADVDAHRHQRNADALIDLVASGHGAAGNARKPEPVVHIMCNCSHNDDGNHASAHHASAHHVSAHHVSAHHVSAHHVSAHHVSESVVPEGAAGELSPRNGATAGHLAYPQTLGGRLIPPTLVNELLADGAAVQQHRVDAAGKIIDNAVNGRFFTTRQKLLIDLQDRTCQHAGCLTRAGHCEHDHIQPAAWGGPTAVANGQILCRFHHRWKHRHDPGPHRPTIFDDSPIQQE